MADWMSSSELGVFEFIVGALEQKSNQWNLASVQNCGDDGANKHSYRQGKEQTAVVLHHDAELGEVAANRAHHDTRCQQRADACRAQEKVQYRQNAECEIDALRVLKL